MNDDGVEYAVPVKAIIKAYENGIKLTRRASKSASSPYDQVVDSAERLQETLEQSLKAIAIAYKECMLACGGSFPDALAQSRACCPHVGSCKC